MRVPLSWLREYVEVDVPVPELVRLFNFSGSKVKAVHEASAGVRGVVAAKVLSIEPHPNADNLTLVEVEAPGQGLERVVCGARNFSVGDVVPYAQVGAQLPDMTLAERKIRGEISRGMLCSGRELGVGTDHSGILVLPPDAQLGAEVNEVLGLDDTVIELELTPNRPDCMGMVGVAREVAALTGAKLEWPDTEVATELRSSDVKVELPDPEACPRYVATYLEGLSVAPSPAWIARRLLAAGQRPVSNLVDVTNYVMLELGHPMHPFDATRVQDHTIVVRRAANGESLTTLDGVKRDLFPEDLLIADPEHALGIAGVMGGLDSEVSSQTTDIILEAAYFDPRSIATTSRKHLLRTEASARFERGMDPEVLPEASARAVQLMMDIAGGAVAPAVDLYPAPVTRPRVTLRPSRTDALLGVHIDEDRQVELLRSVGFGVTRNEELLEAQVPSWRPDVSREVDLIEEVARLEGLDKLPSTLPPGRIGGLEDDQAAERRLRITLAGLGIEEAWTTSFMSPHDPDALGLEVNDPRREVVEVDNPMSEEERLLRTTLLPGLLRAARHNLARGTQGVALFEIARVYQPSGDVLPRELSHLAGIFAGSRRPASWKEPAADWDFFSVKGVLQAMLDSLHLGAPEFAATDEMPLHPTRAASVSDGDRAWGIFGELHPEVCAAFDLPPGATAFELDLRVIIEALPGRATAGSVPRYPPTLIDLAVVVEENQAVGAIEETVKTAGAPETSSVRLFDIYRGPQIPEGKKSLAFALELRDPERTLTEQDASVVREKIMRELSERFGARLRG